MLGLGSKLLSSDVCLKLVHCKTLKKNWQLRELSEHEAAGWTGCGTSSAPASSERVHLKEKQEALACLWRQQCSHSPLNQRISNSETFRLTL